MGAACTSVVTEFRQRLDHHTAPITIEVERMNLSEMKQNVKAWISAYRFFKVQDEDDEDGLYEIPQDEKAQAYKEYMVAKSSLDAVFQEQASDFGGTDELLRDSSENALQNIQSTFFEWTEQIEWPEGEGQSGDDHIWTGTANTGEECNDVTEEFMGDSHWPFVRIIR
jgi:hypothetical protein